jgi:acyl-CoA synthetase (AMP-forming)/AMP-acid ligase II
MTLIEMVRRNRKKSPEKPAIIYRHAAMTYREMEEAVTKVANALRDFGIQEGDRVGLMLPRIPELIIGFLGAVMAGGIVAPINFERLHKEILATLSHISPRCLIVHKQFLDLARRSVPPNSNLFMVVVDGEDAEGQVSWEQMLKGKKSDPLPIEIDKDDVAYLNYTSGSTGTSKGALTTHSNIYWNTVASVDTFQMTSEDIHLCIFAPFAHPHEIFARPLYLGGTIVLVDKIFPKSVLEAIADHGVTCVMGLAPMYENLLEVLEYKAYDLSSLRILESGGMHTWADLIERFRRKLGVPILPVWGSTETTGIAIANHFGEQIPMGSIGRPCPSYEVKIIDEDHRELPPGEIGEFIFRGPGVVQGYYQDALSTQSCFKHGWYYSGDLGRRDEENNFYFIDRKTGMMKVAGLKVYPSEIESVLMEHPDIKEVAVISVKEKLRGEVPKAIIVMKSGKDLTEKEVILFCRERMPNYKVPRIVEFRETLPKTGSGKINKKELQMERECKSVDY